MKIQAARTQEFAATSQTHAADRSRGAQGAGQATQASEPQTDRLEVSSGARLADYAIKAAHDAPEIRQDVVERARQKLTSGELGRDVDRLAGRMIDALLGS